SALLGRSARSTGGVLAVPPPGEDPPDAVWPLCGGPTRSARTRKTGDFQLSGLYLHLQHRSKREIPAQTENPARPPAGQAQASESRDATAAASIDSRAGKMVEAGPHRLLRLLCGADQRSDPFGVPRPDHRTLATLASATQPKGSHDLGADHETGQRLSPQSPKPPSVAAGSLCRQTPEVGAECPNRARSDLCGGRSAMSVPTAIFDVRGDCAGLGCAICPRFARSRSDRVRLKMGSFSTRLAVRMERQWCLRKARSLIGQAPLPRQRRCASAGLWRCIAMVRSDPERSQDMAK